MKVVITGGHGFLGWHVWCRLRAIHGIDAVRVGRAELADQPAWEQALADADAVIHLAGVNRAQTDAEVEQGNIALAEHLGAALGSAVPGCVVVYANSTQSELDNPYGRGKRRAGNHLADAARAGGARFVDVVLPNIFGEHGKPRYNSFVATFCDAIARGEEPTIQVDREVPLLHAQRAAAVLIDAVLDAGISGTVRPAGTPRTVSGVLSTLHHFHEVYGRGDIPILDDFDLDLFNTYRAATFPQAWPLHPTLHSDPRGDLFETHRAYGGTSQSYVSTTKPGQVRGEHYHLRKIERFIVLAGEAEIGLRRLGAPDAETITFAVSGERPAIIDMPTLWVHNLRNTGSGDLITMFWSDQILDPANVDQFPERVLLGGAG